MDFKNSIYITVLKEDKYSNTPNKKLLIPLEMVKGVQQIHERDYSAQKINDEYPIVAFTVISIDAKFALDNDLCEDKFYKLYYHGYKCPFGVRVKEDFNIICGLLKGDKAAQVLFNE